MVGEGAEGGHSTLAFFVYKGVGGGIGFFFIIFRKYDKNQKI